MADRPLQWYGPGLGRPAAPSPHSQAERERLRAALAPANAARAEAFARARPAGAEIPAMLVTGLLADIPAGLTGLATAPFQGGEQAARNVEAVQEALTYQPRGDAALQALQSAQPAMQTVADAMRAPADWVSDKTDSPALATATAVAPDAALELLGAGWAARAARRGPSMTRRALNFAGRHPTVPLTAGGAAVGGLLDGEEGAMLGGAAGLSLGLLDRSVGGAMPTNLPTNVPRSQRGIFAGFSAAQDAPREALALAEQMAREGRMSRLEVGSAEWHDLNRRIHQATGQQFGAESAVHFGLDMLPRWEISDRFAATVNENPAMLGPEGVNNLTWRKRRDVLSHPTLDAAYPGTRDIDVGWTDPGAGSPKFEGAYMGPASSPIISMILPLLDEVGARTDGPREVLLHELQHDIQRREGFGRGGNTNMFKGHRNPMLEYARVAGEAEARAAGARRDLSPLERARRYPFEDYSLPTVVPSTKPGAPDTVNWDQLVPVPLDRRWWNPGPQATRSPDIYGLFDD